jgi:DNA-binding GntR family transcriptional regulator
MKRLGTVRKLVPADNWAGRKLSMDAVETVTCRLRQLIFDGDLPAGQKLRQEELAARLGTSRHPVREALGRLTGEGLVTFRARYGYRVAAFGPQEITEVFEMRMVLEEHAGYVATINRTPAAVARVAETIGWMNEFPVGSDGDFRRWSQINKEFHARLFAASGRRHLCRLIGTLRDSVESYLRLSMPTLGIEQSKEEHLKIYEAFRDGDATHVSRLCRQHVRHFAPDLVERLRRASSVSIRSLKSKDREFS